MFFSELRTDDRRIHRPSPIDFPDRNPYSERQLESHRFSSQLPDWNTIRRPLSQQSDNARRVLEPSSDTNGYHPTGTYILTYLLIYIYIFLEELMFMRVLCGLYGYLWQFIQFSGLQPQNQFIKS